MARLDQLPPEMLMTILDELRISELAAVIRVNRQFFNLGIRRLWQAQRDIYLAKVPKDRRRVYTPLIQELDLDGDPKALYEEFKDLEFDNVKELSVTLKEDFETIDDCKYLTHFINPGLRLLDLGGSISADFLRDVRNQCPKLRTVSLWRCGPCVTPADLLTFLRSLPYLKSLHITELEDHMITDSEVIEFLAASSTLERLDLEQITPEFLWDALSIEAPFPQLNRLDIDIHHDAVPSIAKLFGSVIQLRVTLRAIEDWFTRETVRIRPLSELTELRTLEISFHGEMILVPEDLVTLRSLRNLASLSLHGLSEVHLGAAEFSDGHFHRLVSGLQDLVTLSLHPIPVKSHQPPSLHWRNAVHISRPVLSVGSSMY
ncbi:hypothetical protein IFM60648_05978 [Aspergillus lentulus]|uniref:F-box domain-containing protein n=1 Tax=Aspergillus lentulus TaxID=293939 RepID=A0ABQ1AG70_ASPLE|nr:hypothetical protein IFM60648_05978 [Aspergillus lentulus]